MSIGRVELGAIELKVVARCVVLGIIITDVVCYCMVKHWHHEKGFVEGDCQHGTAIGRVVFGGHTGHYVLVSALPRNLVLFEHLNAVLACVVRIGGVGGEQL